MKKNILFKKSYKNLRQNVFSDLDFSEFMEVYTNFRRLSIQYKLLRFASFLESLHIPIIEIPIFRFIGKLLDFLRWKLYDFIMFCINGKRFNLYGLTVFCGRQRWWQNYING